MLWFDVDCVVGLPRRPMPYGTMPDVADLTAELQRLGPTQALVRHRACVEGPPEVGNALLLRELAGQVALVPCCHVTVDGQEGEWDPARQVDTLVAAGIRAVWTTGDRDAPSPREPWCAGRLYAALVRHRLPLLLSYNQVQPNTLHAILQEFPQLRLVLLNAPRLGRNAYLYAVLAQHPNLYLVANALYAVHAGIEDFCARFGSERLLFGSGYPEIEGGASLANITYSELTTAARVNIAGGNLQRLLGEVQP